MDKPRQDLDRRRRRRWLAWSPAGVAVASAGIAVRVCKGVSTRTISSRPLINLVKNAVEAQQGREGRIGIEARNRDSTLAVAITDEGPGIANTDNLFVPFFTTKPGGSGVGLALSRQIAEGHGGTLAVENRNDAQGAVATPQIPGAARVI